MLHFTNMKYSLTQLSTSAKSWTLSKGEFPSCERGTKFLSTFKNSLTSGLQGEKKEEIMYYIIYIQVHQIKLRMFLAYKMFQFSFLNIVVRS